MAPRVAVAVLSLATVPADGGTVRADGARPVLRLVWFDPSDIASGSELVARGEAATLLARMGATVRWRRGTSGEVNRDEGIPVILVGEGPPDSGTPILGATHNGRSAAPVVWVRVPNVRTAIGISRRRSGRLSRRQLTAASIPIDLEVALALQAAVRDDHVVAPSAAGVLAANAQAQEKDR